MAFSQPWTYLLFLRGERKVWCSPSCVSAVSYSVSSINFDHWQTHPTSAPETGHYSNPKYGQSPVSRWCISLTILCFEIRFKIVNSGRLLAHANFPIKISKSVLIHIFTWSWSALGKSWYTSNGILNHRDKSTIDDPFTWYVLMPFTDSKNMRAWLIAAVGPVGGELG